MCYHCVISYPPAASPFLRVYRQDNKPRSGIILEALALYLKERERQEMTRDYRDMAKLNRELAEEPVAAVNEVWARYD